MKIAVANDHAGFEFKNKLKQFLQSKGHSVEDFGSPSAEPSDYPDYAVPAVKSVIEGKNDRAILICATGLGMCMVANRFPGIRAALVYNEKTAATTRRHHDSNVLCLGAREFSENDLLKFTDIWLATAFDGGRHLRRINKIAALDRQKPF
ncbi:MAG: ribose 5-phosphate isomerase B [Candidatus Sumerlaeota bacterium]|nr:ribose 5-phosphate isomerase B [Candidatus Sumerlaeota bacterium]